MDSGAETRIGQLLGTEQVGGVWVIDLQEPRQVALGAKPDLD